MAGGSNKKGTGLPAWLVEANATARREAAERAAAIEALRPDRPTHVWVTTAYHGDLPVQVAGLLLEWRRRGAGWEALVVLGRGQDSFVALWLDAEQLQPAAVAALSSLPTQTAAPDGVGGDQHAVRGTSSSSLVPHTLAGRAVPSVASPSPGPLVSGSGGHPRHGAAVDGDGPGESAGD